MYISNNNQSLFYNVQDAYKVNAVKQLNGYNNRNSQQQQNTKTQALEDNVNISDMAKLLFEAESKNDEDGLISLLKEFVQNAQGNGYNAKMLHVGTPDNLQNTLSQKSDSEASDQRISSVNQVLLSKLQAYRQYDYAFSSLMAS